MKNTNTSIHDQYAISQFNDEDFISIAYLPMDEHIFNILLQEYKTELIYCLKNDYIIEAEEQRLKIYNLINQYRYVKNKTAYKLKLAA